MQSLQKLVDTKPILQKIPGVIPFFDRRVSENLQKELELIEKAREAINNLPTSTGNAEEDARNVRRRADFARMEPVFKQKIAQFEAYKNSQSTVLPSSVSETTPIDPNPPTYEPS